MDEQRDRLAAALGDRYRLERELGAGGMATVYLAHDVKHDRRVALKVLRPELAAAIGAERFLTEIRVTANLQHPHVLQLYDSGEADSLLYYVMPYVEGESLRERLRREKQLPVDEAIEITRAVTGALDYAHRRGVIHRDIKPANVLLQDGQPLVADFGIALALSSAGGSRLTETGLSLGTPQYMSPEQAGGDRELDARSDQYALASVLYEMLVGDPPFTGSTTQAILAQVLGSEPVPLVERRGSVPVHVDLSVRKALSKIPADRFPTVERFGEALSNPALAPLPQERRSSAAITWKWVAAALAAIALASVAWALGSGSSDPGARPLIYDVALPDSAPLAFKAYRLPALAVSSDGSFVVYVAQRAGTSELWLRSLVDDRAEPIPGTEAADAPVLSPDGQVVAFLVGGQLKAVPVAGGPAAILADVTDANGLVWASANRLLISDGDANVQRWIDPDAGEVSSHPVRCPMAQPSPDTNLALCVGPTRYGQVVDLRDGTTNPIFQRREPGASGPAPLLRGSDFRFVDEEHVTYVTRDAELRAVSVDMASGTAGRPVGMVQGVRKEALYGAAQYAVSASGTLVYAPGSNAEIGRLVKVTQDGVIQPLPVDRAAFLRFDLSPDGRRIAAVVRVVGDEELRIYDIESGQFAVWQRGTYVGEPLWYPEGDRLLVRIISHAGQAVTLSGSPTAAAAPDTLGGLPIFAPAGFSPDGRILNWDFPRQQALLVTPGSDPPEIDTLASPVYFPSMSPGGRWLAYQNSATGQLFVEPYPSLDRRFQVADEAWEPKWINENELTYWVVDTWYRVTIDQDAERPVGEAEVWFRDPRFSDTLGESYVVTPDGGIIYVQGPERMTASYLRVIPDWVQQVRAAVAAGG